MARGMPSRRWHTEETALALETTKSQNTFLMYPDFSPTRCRFTPVRSPLPPSGENEEPTREKTPKLSSTAYLRRRRRPNAPPTNSAPSIATTPGSGVEAAANVPPPAAVNVFKYRPFR